MKRYNEMTDAELLELTNEQIATLIDYECALDGVPMLPPDPGPAPPDDVPPPDIGLNVAISGPPSPNKTDVGVSAKNEPPRAA